MTDKQINAAIKELFKNGISDVLNGKKKSFKTKCPIIPDDVCKFMEKLKWHQGAMETNGWDYDYWIPFTKDGKSFTLYGHGYYGGAGFEATED